MPLQRREIDDDIRREQIAIHQDLGMKLPPGFLASEKFRIGLFVGGHHVDSRRLSFFKVPVAA